MLLGVAPSSRILLFADGTGRVDERVVARIQSALPEGTVGPPAVRRLNIRRQFFSRPVPSSWAMRRNLLAAPHVSQEEDELEASDVGNLAATRLHSPSAFTIW
jgi:hypothetical protein